MQASFAPCINVSASLINTAAFLTTAILLTLAYSHVEKLSRKIGETWSHLIAVYHVTMRIAFVAATIVCVSYPGTFQIIKLLQNMII